MIYFQGSKDLFASLKVANVDTAGAAFKRPADDSEDSGESCSRKRLACIWGTRVQDPMKETKVLLSMCALQHIPIKWGHMALKDNQLQFINNELSLCKEEIEELKTAHVPGSTISFHHLVSRVPGRVVARLQKGFEVSRFECARKFPIYGGLAIARLMLVEERRVLMDRCRASFNRLTPGLGLTVTDCLMLCMEDGDLENFVRALQVKA